MGPVFPEGAALDPLRIDAVSHDPAMLCRDQGQPSQYRHRAAFLADEPEFVAHDQHGVELPKRGIDVGQGAHLGMLNASTSCHLDGERRLVDRKDLVTSLLQVEADASRSAADIEDAPAHVPHGAPLDRRPAAKGGEVVVGIATVDEPVIPFQDLIALASLERSEQDLAVCVLAWFKTCQRALPFVANNLEAPASRGSVKEERTPGANCRRARELFSLRLDTQISEFETVLLEAHVSRCPECSSFADDVTGFTTALRLAPLELLSRPITVQAVRGRHQYIQRAAAATAIAMLAAGIWGVVGSLDLSSRSDLSPGPYGQLWSHDEQQRFVRSQELRLEPHLERQARPSAWLLRG